MVSHKILGKTCSLIFTTFKSWTDYKGLFLWSLPEKLVGKLKESFHLNRKQNNQIPLCICDPLEKKFHVWPTDLVSECSTLWHNECETRDELESLKCEQPTLTPFTVRHKLFIWHNNRVFNKIKQISTWKFQCCPQSQLEMCYWIKKCSKCMHPLNFSLFWAIYLSCLRTR